MAAFHLDSLLITAVLYGIGITKMLRRTTRRRSLLWPTVWFALGWISLVIALDSPLHELGEQLFWVHMTQHEILMLISAPLLVLGHPLIAFLWAMPSSRRESAATSGAHDPLSDSGPCFGPALGLASIRIGTVDLASSVFFDQTLRSDWIHAAQHTTFLATALIFWWPLVNRTPSLGYGGGLVYIFTTILHTSVLGHCSRSHRVPGIRLTC